MPVPSQGHYGFHSFPVVDWFCLFIYLWVLTSRILFGPVNSNFHLEDWTMFYYLTRKTKWMTGDLQYALMKATALMI
jgi:hypothetical protein